MTAVSLPPTQTGVVTVQLMKALQKNGDEFSNKKILKLLYYVHGWGLALESTWFFPQNSFQAWQYGPVCPEIYNSFKAFGWHNFGLKETDRIEVPYLVNLVALHYGKLNANQPEKLSHNETPWQKNYDGSHFKIIPDEDILEYFSDREIAQEPIHKNFVQDYYIEKDSVLLAKRAS